jgi:membrane protein YqaA with SNARE-associated domain
MIDALQWLELGYAGLFAWAFLAATIVPLSSEAGLWLALDSGFSPGWALVWASAGNCLGALSSVALGMWLRPRAEQRLQQSAAGRLALRWGKQYGGYSLIGSWLPVLGDPLLVAAGMFRVPLGYVLTLGLGTRVLRYGAVYLAWRSQS